MKKRIFALCCILVLLLCCVVAIPKSRADFGDFAGDNDYGGDDGFDWDDDDDDYGGGGTTIITGGSGGGGIGGTIAFVVVVGIVVVLIITSRKKKGGTPVNTGTKATDPSTLTPISQYKQLDTAFDETKFCDKMGNLYMQLQNCWTAKDIEPLRPYLSDNLYNMSNQQLENMKRAGRTNYIERIAVLERTILGYEQQGSDDIIHLLLKTRIVDYTVDREGNVVSGSKTAEKFMTYEWVLTRKSGVTTQEENGTRTINCPNCGASVNINASARCEYCGSVLSVDNFDWVISTIKGIAQVTR